ncbi:MAG TPA: zinc ribbon domain-containing protein [Candidatus Binataceae bacterium]|nr:zinc ribbon domain-containing protein [Candidatus Binataceae bacterium]
MLRIIIGLAMVALTALGLWWAGRRRYRCPSCGRIVRWQDINCPHCGADMKGRHRAGPEMLARLGAESRAGRRSEPRGQRR